MHTNAANLLQHKWNDSFAILWVVFKFGTVVFVLAQCPDGHLIESGCRKQESWNALGHHGERKPGSHFVGVVGTGHQATRNNQDLTRVDLTIHEYWKAYLNSLLSGFESGCGILRTLVPGGRRLRKLMWIARLPNSQICQIQTDCLKKFSQILKGLIELP